MFNMTRIITIAITTFFKAIPPLFGHILNLLMQYKKYSTNMTIQKQQSLRKQPMLIIIQLFM